MEISYLGHSSFKIKSKSASLVTDPFDQVRDPDLGIKFPKVEAEIVTVSHEHADHNGAYLVGGNPFVIAGPGEYEIKSISVFGLATSHGVEENQKLGENTIYLIEADGIRICHLGDLGEDLTDKQLAEIDGVDVLMVPVGGRYTIGLDLVNQLIKKIEPLLILPMHFKIPEMKGDYKDSASLADFLKKTEVANVATLPKLVFSKDKMPVEVQVVILERKG